MVSRDTTVHIAAVMMGVVVLFLSERYTIGPETGSAPIAGFLLFYGLVLGGAHFYLAVRGEGGMIPVAARWRYVAMLAVLLGTGAMIFYGGDRTVATVSLSTIGLVVIILTLVIYFFTESIAGYESARSE